jgi:dUTPase
MIRITRIRDVGLPRRAHADDAGIDFFMPTIDEAFVRDYRALTENQQPYPKSGAFDLWVPPRTQARIPSGIICEIPKRTGLFQFDKSGVTTQSLLKVLACVVDSGYQGELKLSVFNLSDRGVFLVVGKPLVQFVLLPILDDAIEEFDSTEVFTRESSRGAGGFGSTSL